METDSLASLTPNARNPRKISKKKLAMLKESMAYYGDLSGIIQLANGGDLVGGHQRVEAFRGDRDAKVEITQRYDPPLENGTVAEGYVTAAGSRFAYRVCDWAPDKAQGAMLAANKGAGEWDLPLVADMMGELDGAGFEMDLTLFDSGERNTLLSESAPADDVSEGEQAEEIVTVEARAKQGDVFIMGKHRLMCGDSTNPQHVDALMAGEKVDLVFTSPPYMQQRDYGKVIDDWRQLMLDVFTLLPVKQDAQVLVNLGIVHVKEEWQPYWDAWIEDMRKMGWRRYAFYVWSKTGGGMPCASQGRLASDWEPIFHFNKQSKVPHKTKKCLRAGESIHASTKAGRSREGDVQEWSGQKNINETKVASAVIDAPTARDSQWNHPAKFSRHLCREIIEPYSNQGDFIFEPFGGAGTTLIAAEEAKRVCFAMELEPKYCDIILARWESLTGEAAILEEKQ